MLFGFNLLVFMSVLGQCKLGSSVKIDITTQYHDGVIPNAFNIRCVPQTHGNCAKSVISIQLTKDDGKNIVNLKGGDVITYNPLLESSLQAEGHIDQDLTKTYLSVTIKEAVKEDSGLYTCKLLVIDEALQFRFVTASDNVTVTNQDTQDIIKHLMSKISFLENLVKFQQDELSNVKTNLVSQGTELQGVKTTLVNQGTQFQSISNKANQSVMDLGEKVTTLETEMIVQNEKQKTHFDVELQEQKTHFDVELQEQKSHFDVELKEQKNKFDVELQEQKNKFDVELQEQKTTLTNQIQTLDQHLAVHSTKENTTVTFTALHTGSGDFRSGQILIYSNVVDNVGGGYDGQTGVFRAPVAGYYLLQISMASNGKQYIEVDLKSGNGDTFARMATGDYQWQDYSFMSCVSMLEQGETVWLFIRSGSSSFTFYSGDTPDKMHRFYGYLLKKL